MAFLKACIDIYPHILAASNGRREINAKIRK
jgi:hypothetical protein